MVLSSGSTQLIELNQTIAVGTLNIALGNASSLALSSGTGGGLALNSGGVSPANINILSGTASATSLLNPIYLASDVNIATTGAASVAISGNIGQASAHAITLNGSGSIVLSGTNTYSGGTTLAGGTLSATSTSALGTGSLTFAGGTYGFPTFPGLVEGHIENAPFDTAGANPGNGGVQSSFRTGETNGSPWITNQTWIYTGQFFTADGTAAFAENIDDSALVKIDGVVYLDNTLWNQPSSTGKLFLTPGWHSIEVRFGNGIGGAGAEGNINGAAGWSSTYGFGMATDAMGVWSDIAQTATLGVPSNGFTTSDNSQPDGADYVDPIDPGNGTLFRTNPIPLANAVAVSAGNTAYLNAGMQVVGTVSGNVTGTGGLQTSGSGTIVLSGNNTYSGTTAISTGTLQAGSSNAFSADSVVSLASGSTLSANGFSVSTGGIGGAGAIIDGSATPSVVTENLAAGSTIFSGTISDGASGHLGLTIAGTGSLVLSGHETNTGPTRVASGSLWINGIDAASPITVIGTLGGIGSAGSVVVANGGTLQPGQATTTGILTLNSLAFAPVVGNAAPGSLSIRVAGAAAGTQYDQLIVAGALDLQNAALTIVPESNLNAGDSYTILSNVGSYPITGTFRGLIEGGLLEVGGLGFQITYQGGASHHDVVLANLGPLDTYYVDSTWAGDSVGQNVPDADPIAGGNQEAIYGTTAFSSIAAAVTAAVPFSTIVVNGGIYDESVVLSGTYRLIFQSDSASIGQIVDTTGTSTIELNDVSLTIGSNRTSPSTILSAIKGSGSIIVAGSQALTLTGDDVLHRWNHGK